MKEPIAVNIVNDTVFSSDNIVAIIAIGVAVVTFVIERSITVKREKKNDKYNWFLSIIIEPQLPKIREFYDNTHKDLKESIDYINSLPSTTSLTDLILAKRERIQLFKSRRVSYMNYFVSMLSSYDRQLEIKIDNVINRLDDIYSSSLDNTEQTTTTVSTQIYKNQTLFYAILFSEIKKKN